MNEWYLAHGNALKREGVVFKLTVQNKSFLLFFKDFILFIFRERGREGEERERNISVWLPLVHPLPGAWPTTQACALTGN